MKPRFKTTLAWEQAELLMQPAFLRIIDHIRKQLEQSNCQGTYEDVETPIPGYQLCLQQGDKEVKVNIWDLCFQVCFQNGDFIHSELQSQDVEIDASLIDETGDIEWERLDAKARQLVEELFASLNDEPIT